MYKAYPKVPAEILEDLATQNFNYSVRNDTVLARYWNTREALGKTLEIEAAHKAFPANRGSKKCMERKSRKKIQLKQLRKVL